VQTVIKDKERGDGTAANRVDGLTGFFTDEVRLSHHVAYGSRTTRFVKHNAVALYTNWSLSYFKKRLFSDSETSFSITEIQIEFRTT
jgi:hypothetical protein